ncbi:MAG: ABC transporter ATP-binding protein [Actinomycetales bacterium]|nr:ABC transporter ATP-binding protein [Actinomycetales bacterium]
MTVTAPPARGAITAGEPIRLTSVNKTYTTATGPLPVLQDIDLHIETGEFVSLVGPSGCGKSTLLKIIAGLIPFDNGTVHVGEQAPKEGRRDVGFMLQQSVLMPWLSVRENVTLPFAIAREKGSHIAPRVEELLELVGLSHSADMNSWELSGGMQQRVALARTLALDPRVLLMDEPFAALDEFKREHLGLEVTKMHEDMGKTSILVTHSIPEAVMMSDRIIALGARPGRVVGDIRVDLPRPRSAAMIATPEFQDISRQVREALAGEDGSIS